MRPEPTPSDELIYLDKVIRQDESQDDPNDFTLKRYRKKMIEDDTWVLEQKRIAEREWRKECAEWRKDKEAEDKALAKEAAETKDAKKTGKDIGTARCLEKLDKLLRRPLAEKG